MWRIAVGVACAGAVILALLAAMNMWPFGAQPTKAEGISSDSGLTLVDGDEIVRYEHSAGAGSTATVSNRKLPPLLGDPILILDTTLNLVEEQDVSPKVETGQIGEILVHLGQRVRAGQEVAVIDDTMARRTEEIYRYKASSNQQIVVGKKTYEVAKKIADKADALVQQRVISERDGAIDHLNAERAYSDWIKAYEEQQVAIREWYRAKQELDNHRVVTKIAGEIVKMNRQAGEPIRQGDVLFHIMNFDRLRAEGAAKVERQQSVRVGMRAVVEPEIENGSVKDLRGHTGAIRGLAVTPDGRYLASASEDGTVLLWEIHSGRRLAMLRDEQLSEIQAIACCPVIGGTTQQPSYLFLTGRSDGSAQLWRLVLQGNGHFAREKAVDLGTGAYSHRGAVRSVAFSVNGEFCATGGEDRQIYLWNTSEGKLIYRLTGDQEGRGTAHRGIVTTLHFTPDNYLISAATDKTLKKWKLAEKPELVNRQTGRVGDVDQLGMSADGTRVLFDLGDELRVLDANTFEILGTLQSHRHGQYQQLALFAPSGKTVLTRTANGRLQLLSVPASLNEARWLREKYEVGFRSNSPLVLAALTANLAPSGQFLLPAIAATAAEQPTQPRAPDVTPFVASMLPGAMHVFPAWFIKPNDFRGMTVVPQLWPLNSYEVRHLVLPDAATVTCAAYSPDETLAFTAGTDKIIRVWQLPSAREFQRPMEAMVTFVGNQVQSGTGLVQVRAEFDNTPDPARRLMPGTRVNLTIYPESASKE